MLVLVLNTGSSSLKYQLRDVATGSFLAGGLCERIGGDATLTHRTRIGRDGEDVVVVTREVADHAEALALVDEVFEATGPVRQAGPLAAVGHRVVHGGDRFSAPVVVDDDVLTAVRELVPLAPLHNPANLVGMEVALARYPDVPSVAVFDTAFHQTLPPAAYTYAIDRGVAAAYGVRRYGFHGTSHAYVSRVAAQALDVPLDRADLVTLHLGNGASATAVSGGRSVDTSMGLSPLQGLVMGSRSGDIDPAVVFHLVREAGMSVSDVDAMLNSRSGLVGLCGDNDLRAVHERIRGGDPDARLALQVYVHRIRTYVGAYLAVLGRADALVFTAGVGENDPVVRAEVCRGLERLGIELDPARNDAARGPTAPVDVATAGSTVRVLVVPTDEELEIAAQAATLVGADGG